MRAGYSPRPGKGASNCNDSYSQLLIKTRKYRWSEDTGQKRMEHSSSGILGGLWQKWFQAGDIPLKNMVPSETGSNKSMAGIQPHLWLSPPVGGAAKTAVVLMVVW